MYIWPIDDQSPTPSGVEQWYLLDVENEDSVKQCYLLNVENEDRVLPFSHLMHELLRPNSNYSFKVTYMYILEFSKDKSNSKSKELFCWKIEINMILKSPHSEVCIYSSQIIF